MKGCGGVIDASKAPKGERTCSCGWTGPHVLIAYRARPGGKLLELKIGDPHRAPCGAVCAQAFPPGGLKLGDPLHHADGSCPVCRKAKSP